MGLHYKTTIFFLLTNIPDILIYTKALSSLRKLECKKDLVSIVKESEKFLVSPEKLLTLIFKDNKDPINSPDDVDILWLWLHLHRPVDARLGAGLSPAGVNRAPVTLHYYQIVNNR